MHQYFVVFSKRLWEFMSDNKVVVAIAGVSASASSALIAASQQGIPIDWWIVGMIISWSMSALVIAIAIMLSVIRKRSFLCVCRMGEATSSAPQAHSSSSLHRVT